MEVATHTWKRTRPAEPSVWKWRSSLMLSCGLRYVKRSTPSTAYMKVMSAKSEPTLTSDGKE